ncbi:MAG: hypothetical protein VXY81_14490, partial [Pseudomonadota bacterium]|nr:hypothetical protein [Pseudomonadota bacterium]
EYAAVEVEPTSLAFRPTMMFQVRSHTFALANPGAVALPFRWRVTAADGSREPLPPHEAPFSASPAVGGGLAAPPPFSLVESSAPCGRRHSHCGGAAARAMVAEGPGRDLLRGIFANSPYLTQICLREQATMMELAAAGPTALFETIVNEAAALDAANLPIDRLMRALRLMKRRASLCVAVADITDSWPLAEITRALTRMAETALAQAFRHALATTVARGRLPLTLGDDPLVDSG